MSNLNDRNDSYQSSDSPRDPMQGGNSSSDGGGGGNGAATGETRYATRIVGRCVSRHPMNPSGTVPNGVSPSGLVYIGWTPAGPMCIGWTPMGPVYVVWTPSGPMYGAPMPGSPMYGAPMPGSPMYGAPMPGSPMYGAASSDDFEPVDDGRANVIHAYPVRGCHVPPVYGYPDVQRRAASNDERHLSFGSLMMIIVVALVAVWGISALGFDIRPASDHKKTPTTVAFASREPTLNDSLQIIHPPSISFEEYAAAMATLNPVFATDTSKDELRLIYDALAKREIDPAVHAAVVAFDVQAAGEAAKPPYHNIHGVLKSHRTIQSMLGWKPEVYAMASYPSYLDAVKDWMQRVCPGDVCKGKTVQFIVDQQCFQPNCDPDAIVSHMRVYVASLRTSRSSP